MTLTHGFELIHEQEIPELRSTARIYRHHKTHGRLLSMRNDDENKVFGIVFRTPPKDSTGVAHILEHSVLCGSAKYPAKEPFVELVKGSLHTFLNAFTYSDKTCYPVASTNEKDFHNLIDVYLDAVFYPRLTPEVLMQEGWHLEAESVEATPQLKGVVFNEMKGVYSSSDSLLGQLSQQSLFPDTTYGLDSGGEPRHIPALTFADFAAFHRNHYHPSNGYAFFWGDDDEDKRLQVLDAYYSHFERSASDSAVQLQKPFATPRRLEQSFPAGDDETKLMFTVNICLGENIDPDRNLAWQVLEHILLGLPASPLRKALTDSELGEDLTGGGVDNDLRQPTFAVGLKGVAEADLERAVALIDDTLRGLADSGLNAEDVEAGVNSVEFDLRELNTGSFPRGLSIMLTAMETWLYDGDPLALLPYEERLARLKQRLAAGERVFEDMIRRQLLDNPHRSVVVLRPDATLAQQREQDEQRQVQQMCAPMDDAARVQLVETTQALLQRQAEPDTPEALAAIPHLTLADLERNGRDLPLTQSAHQAATVLYHDVPTSGIVYVDAAFDLNHVPDRLLPYAPLLGRALVETGTSKQDFVSLSRRIARKTGGVYHQVFVTPVRDSDDSAARLILRGRATVPMVGELSAILREVLLDADLSNKQRLKQIALESKARREQRLIPAGHISVATRLRARFGRAGQQNELCSGISQLFFLRQLLDRMDSDFDSIIKDLEELRSLLLGRDRLLLNVTLEQADYTRVQDSLLQVASALPLASAGDTNTPAVSYAAQEGLVAPAQVSYVGRGANVFAAGFDYTGAAHVVSRLLSTTYLWEQVRVQGGAYGCFSLFDKLSGTLCFVSYRDPNLKRTLETYAGVGDFLRSGRFDVEEIERSIIGTIGEIDSHLLPDAKGFMSMGRHLCGDDDAFRQRVREQVLATSVDDIARFAEAADTVASHGDVVVLGGRETLQAELPDATLTELL